MAQTLHIDYSDVTKLWVNANQTTQCSADGDAIGAAIDQSIATRGLVSSGIGNVPLYRTPANGIRNKSVAQFTAASSRNNLWSVNAGAGPVSYPTLDDIFNSDAYTLMMVFQAEADGPTGNPGTNNDGMRLFNNTAQTADIRIYTNAGVHQLYCTGSGGTPTVLGPLAFTRDVPVLVTLRYASGTLYASVNGGVESSGALASQDVTGNVWFGVSFVYVGYFTGKQAELKAWDTGNADGALTTQQNQLLAKWGIRAQGGSGAGHGSKGNKGGGGVNIQTPGSPGYLSYNPGVDISAP
jgi:hypothetical protein